MSGRNHQLEARSLSGAGHARLGQCSGMTPERSAGHHENPHRVTSRSLSRGSLTFLVLAVSASCRCRRSRTWCCSACS
jgi:hypothetical protein